MSATYAPLHGSASSEYLTRKSLSRMTTAITLAAFPMPPNPTDGSSRSFGLGVGLPSSMSCQVSGKRSFTAPASSTHMYQKNTSLEDLHREVMPDDLTDTESDEEDTCVYDNVDEFDVTLREDMFSVLETSKSPVPSDEFAFMVSAIDYTNSSPLSFSDSLQSSPMCRQDASPATSMSSTRRTRCHSKPLQRSTSPRRFDMRSPRLSYSVDNIKSLSLTMSKASSYTSSHWAITTTSPSRMFDDESSSSSSTSSTSPSPNLSSFVLSPVSSQSSMTSSNTSSLVESKSISILNRGRPVTHQPNFMEMIRKSCSTSHDLKDLDSSCKKTLHISTTTTTTSQDSTVFNTRQTQPSSISLAIAPSPSPSFHSCHASIHSPSPSSSPTNTLFNDNVHVSVIPLSHTLEQRNQSNTSWWSTHQDIDTSLIPLASSPLISEPCESKAIVLKPKKSISTIRSVKSWFSLQRQESARRNVDGLEGEYSTHYQLNHKVMDPRRPRRTRSIEQILFDI